ncbi:MAG TPA: MaoC family dehydratase [Burkholderiales bacterium]|jgi:itaconyl-CoA hydratase|nr:MaoC family dehydratase [Burkholderiales bacterium]
MAGRYYEDFEVGATYHHRPGRTLSEADNTWFTLLTMNTHPIHIDAEYAKRTEFGKPLVVSTLTLAVLVGMSVADTSRNAVANLGWKEIKLPKPVFAGDTLYAESTVLETRESKSRPNEGVVTIRTLGRNQHGVVVCEFERTFLVMKRSHPLAAREASSGASY